MLYSFVDLEKQTFEKNGHTLAYYKIPGTSIEDEQYLQCSSQNTPDSIKAYRLYDNLSNLPTGNNSKSPAHIRFDVSLDYRFGESNPQKSATILYSEEASKGLHMIYQTRGLQASFHDHRDARNLHVLDVVGRGVMEFEFEDHSKTKTIEFLNGTVIVYDGTIEENKDILIEHGLEDDIEWIVNQEMYQREAPASYKEFNFYLEQVKRNLSRPQELENVKHTLEHPLERKSVLYQIHHHRFSISHLMVYDPEWTQQFIRDNREMFNMDSLTSLLNINPKEVEYFKSQYLPVRLQESIRDDGNLDWLYVKDIVQHLNHYTTTEKATKSIHKGKDDQERDTFSLYVKHRSTGQEDILDITRYADGKIQIQSLRDDRVRSMPTAHLRDLERLTEFLDCSEHCQCRPIQGKTIVEHGSSRLALRVLDSKDIFQKGGELYDNCVVAFAFENAQHEKVYKDLENCKVFESPEQSEQYWVIIDDATLNRLREFASEGLKPLFGYAEEPKGKAMKDIFIDQPQPPHLPAKVYEGIAHQHGFTYGKSSSLTHEERFERLLDVIASVPGTEQQQIQFGYDLIDNFAHRNEGANTNPTGRYFHSYDKALGDLRICRAKLDDYARTRRYLNVSIDD